MMILANSGGLEALLDWLLESFGSSPWLLGLVLMCSTMASEDLTCIAGGVLAASGAIPFFGAVAAGAAGIWIGDMGL